MATLIHLETRQKVILRANHTFGRDPHTNVTALRSPGASRNHATMTWDGEKWQIKDASSNGTYINKKRIPTGNFHAIEDGSIIQFGSLPSEAWQVLDITPPVTCLVPMNGQQNIIPLHDIEILPITGTSIVIFLAEDGQWQCESEGETQVLSSGNKVGAQGMYWQFIDARSCAATAAVEYAPPQNDIEFNFSANLNEEHVSLKLVVNEKAHDLGERNHHYLLLILARKRLEDMHNGLSTTDQGWISKSVLMQMMGLIEQHLNIQIHRFRKQVTEAINETTLHQIIERRPGEIRFAYTSITIKGGFQQQEIMKMR